MTDHDSRGRGLAERLADALDREATGAFRVVDRTRRVAPTPDGAFAYAIAADGTALAEVFVAPERVRVEFTAAQERAARAGADADLRVRPKATRPPRTLAFVESPGDVERALDAFEAVLTAVE
ncbi:hypothetical protein HZS55_08295 [Halosimplex rubrum]|uniref:DUF7993 domain-containing protein n=1 Tax=Halosimplex rubrum TaxID=869889 RepID=A0A7D5TL85_9EURY|nr:hypothetical protein [Halosimplex rubrum]QLH77292.1 hypothetical protein HZS55_08295 [Halosimplex rubrum]